MEHPLDRPRPSAGLSLPQLDALRGAAILAVFAQHLGDRFLPFVEARIHARLSPASAAWILTVIHHAHWGVDLFFVLSGFSLALGYLRDNPPSPGDFLLRRAARIMPAYVVAIAVTLAFHRDVLAHPSIAASLAAHLVLLQGYAAPGGIVIIGAAWSLTTEAHFYLILPWIARRLTRSSALVIGLVLAAWITRAALHDVVLVPGVRTGLLELTQRRLIVSRLDQFVLGAAGAAIFVAATRSTRSEAYRRAAPLVLALSAALLVVGFRLEGELYLAPRGAWPYALISIATFGIVTGASLTGGVARRIVAPSWLSAIGVVSYGMFLYHQLMQGIAGAWLNRAGLTGETWTSLAANAALGLALSIGAGLLSWVVVERPVIRRVAARGR